MIRITEKGQWCIECDTEIKPGEYFSREKDGAVLCMPCAAHYSAIADRPEPEGAPPEVFYPAVKETVQLSMF